MQPVSEGGLLDNANCADVQFPGSDVPNRVVAMFFSKLRLEERQDHANVEVPPAQVAVTGAIPGIYVYKDFITPEEEQDMVTGIDSHDWIKLLNRRVQHYGYEFKYGTNNVDTTSKIGDLPAFCEPIIPRMSAVMGEFKSEKPDEAEFVGEGGNYFEKFGMFD